MFCNCNTLHTFIVGFEFVKHFYRLFNPNQTIFSKTVYRFTYMCVLFNILSFCSLSFATVSSVITWSTIQFWCNSQKSFVKNFKLKTRFRSRTGLEWLAILNRTLEISENDVRRKNRRLDFILFNYHKDFSQIIIFDRFVLYVYVNYIMYLYFMWLQFSIEHWYYYSSLKFNCNNYKILHNTWNFVHTKNTVSRASFSR